MRGSGTQVRLRTLMLTGSFSTVVSMTLGWPVILMPSATCAVYFSVTEISKPLMTGCAHMRTAVSVKKDARMRFMGA